MFGMGTSEILIILTVVIVVFGAKKLPALGAGLGKGIRDFQRGILGKGEAEGKKDAP